MENWMIGGHICSQHAQKRMQQRGIKKQTVETILLYADKTAHCKGATSSIFLSKKAGRKLLIKKVVSPALMERALNLIVLIANDVIVTVYPRRKGRLKFSEM
mgnify:CR=1 FL=1